MDTEQIVQEQIKIKKQKEKKTEINKEKKSRKKREPSNEPKVKKNTKKIKIVNSSPIVINTEQKSSPIVIKNERLNEKIVQLLSKLSELMLKKGDMVRSRTYKRAEETILGITYDITDISQIKGLPGIGPTIIEKVEEFLSTGTLSLFEREKDNPEHVLSDIYGIGPKKAKELVEKGIKSIEQLRIHQDEVLNDIQKIGLKYYEDILEKIPRDEIDQYHNVFDSAFIEASKDIPESKYEIVGSYRRGANVSGDIDVIITSSSEKTFIQFINILIQKKIIIEVLSRGKTKSLVICKLPSSQYARRVDFLYTTPQEYPFAVLYFTGSKSFNTVMRGHALKLGYSLNEHGMSKIVDKKKEEKVDHVFKTEKDIFDFLHLEFKEPNERIDGRSIVMKSIKEPLPISVITSTLNNSKSSPIQENPDVVKTITILVKKTRKPRIPKKDKPEGSHNVTKKIRKPKIISEEMEKKKAEKELIKAEKEKKKAEKELIKAEKEKKKAEKELMKAENTHNVTKKIRKPKIISEEMEKKKAEKELLKAEKEKKKAEKELMKAEKEQKKAEKELMKAEKEKSEKEKKKSESSHNVTKKIRKPKLTTEDKVLKTSEEEKTKLKEEPHVETKSNDIKITNEVLKTSIMSQEMKPSSVKIIEKKIADFRNEGITVIENCSEQELSEIISVASSAYYNTNNPLMTDNEYDIVKEFMEKKYPRNPIMDLIGAPVTKNKVVLPYIMASMDKIKPDTNALSNWMNLYKGPYVVSCKLDGVSGMYSTEGDTPKLYTRGNGKIGQDISHFIPVFNLPKHKGMVVRGEFIIPKSVFESKYKDRFANARNLVTGIINSKTIDDKAKDVHFVAYEVISPVMKPSDQMSQLVTLNHEVVMNRKLDTLTNESLSNLLLEWRNNYMYEIDGVIVTNDLIYPRGEGNPEHSFAFKMIISDQVAEAKVVDVLWSASKDGYLKPRVRIEPIRLAGVTIEYATGFNGKFIEDNKIGIGALIQIIRSGDVIPYIKAITTPADHAKMPNVPYKWTDTHVDIMLEDSMNDPTVLEKNITGFFVELKVDGLSTGNVKRLISAGFNSVPKILHMEKNDFSKVEGFKTKLTEKIYNSIHEKVMNASLIDIMVASNTLGRGLGHRKIEPIMKAFPNILTSMESNETKIQMLKTINGIGTENAKTFVNNIPIFLSFLRECGLESKLTVSPVIPENQIVEMDANILSHPLYKKKIVMTKVRDAEIISALPKYGATLENNMSRDTFVLIVKSLLDESNKTKYAKDHNINIMTPDTFKQTYLR